MSQPKYMEALGNIQNGTKPKHPVGNPGDIVARGAIHFEERHAPALMASHYCSDWYIMMDYISDQDGVKKREKMTEGRWVDWVSFAKDILRCNALLESGIEHGKRCPILVEPDEQVIDDH